MDIDLEVLRSLQLGTGKAETDELHLGQSFEPIPELNSLVSEDPGRPSAVDLVSGEKGSGKSALAWGLHEYAGSVRGETPLLLVDLLEAFDDINAELRETFRAATESKTAIRQVTHFWASLIDVAVALELCKRQEIGADTKRRLVHFLSGYGIDQISQLETRSERTLAAIRAAVALSEIDTEPNSDRILAASKAQQRQHLELVEILVGAEVYVWVLVDRLDELFVASQQQWESRCLAGLVTLLQSRGPELIAESTRIRLKVLTRTDFLARARRSGDGLTNPEAIRERRISWTRESFARLVVRWLSLSGPFVEIFPAKKDELAQEHLRRLLPVASKQGTAPVNLLSAGDESPDGRSYSFWDWLCVYATDRHSAYNPRYVLWVLSAASQLAVEEAKSSVSGTKFDTSQRTLLLGSKHIYFGWITAARRARESLIAESSELAGPLEAGLPIRKARLRNDELHSWLAEFTSSPSALLQLLCDVNVFERDGLEYRVTPIYLASLRVPVSRHDELLTEIAD